MSDTIQFTKKICGVFEKAVYFLEKFLQNGISISRNVFGEYIFAGNDWSVWWSYFKNVGYLHHLISIYVFFVQMTMIVIGRNELFKFM